MRVWIFILILHWNWIWEVQLIQMQKQYKIINPGGSVLDLGCAPGAWLQVQLCHHYVTFMCVSVCVFLCSCLLKICMVLIEKKIVVWWLALCDGTVLMFVWFYMCVYVCLQLLVKDCIVLIEKKNVVWWNMVSIENCNLVSTAPECRWHVRTWVHWKRVE